MLAATTRQWQPPLFDLDVLTAHQAAARQLERQFVRRMCYDDALVCGTWRLEYLHLIRVIMKNGVKVVEDTFPQYVLYKGRQPYAKAEVRSPRRLPDVQCGVAVCLVAKGFTPDATELVVCGTLTMIDADIRAPRLFSQADDDG